MTARSRKHDQSRPCTSAPCAGAKVIAAAMILVNSRRRRNNNHLRGDRRLFGFRLSVLRQSVRNYLKSKWPRGGDVKIAIGTGRAVSCPENPGEVTTKADGCESEHALIRAAVAPAEDGIVTRLFAIPIATD